MLLLTPGPTPVHPQAAEAMRRPMIPHRGPEFTDLLARVRPSLARVFQTAGPVLVFAGSGTSAMEAAIWSLARPGDATCSVACGRFGERWAAALDHRAALFTGPRARVHTPWGTPTDLDVLAAALTTDTALVTVTHSETSAAAFTDLHAVARVVRDRAPNALLIADAVTSLAAIELDPDAWGVDACVSASQKALMLPPGLAIVSLGPRAVERLRSTPSAAPASMDLRWRLDAFDRGTVANTPPIPLWFGLERALEIILDEGLTARWTRVAALASRTRSELTSLGFTLAAKAPVDSLTAAFYPPGTDDRLRHACRRRGIILAGGQDHWAGKLLRISHMGAVDDAMTTAALDAIRDAL